ncbi:sigma-70 family RNA polymerase sigma factor [Siminovitchia acidinfaciens]|uniref:Sigma-70 family RNA polymerase sigma factor n=1 Tax=Siminovitchia acidinfaciens TaxID=2321395 RepID=A0A429Y3U6_9BACI|nr:sigma-70 family RNA polymerase sigma factor [Siminovitchia acidinfaciens]RST76094.1 sigma-70 family RNA polymerase sigma factor [Siminovitchia acidinfaciens]
MRIEEKERLLNESMEQFGDYVKKLIFTYVQDIHRTEDIVQEVFIKFYKSLDCFEGRSSLKTYLYRIAVNESKNYLKSWHYRKLELTAKVKCFHKRDSLEEDYIQKEHNQTIAKLVNELPIKYREVIWLYYYVELSVSEIAYVLKCSPNTVKTRLARGRRKAKISFEESDVINEH